MHRLPGQRILLRQLQRLQLPLRRQMNKKQNPQTANRLRIYAMLWNQAASLFRSFWIM